MDLKSKIFIFLSLLFLIFIIFFLPKFLRVGKISCESQFGPCSQILLTQIEMIQNERLGQARARLKEILSKEILVKEFCIHYQFPRNLEVSTIERKAKFTLKNKSEKSLAFVDEEGYIVSIDESSNLPRIIISESAGNVGEKIQDKQLFALEILNELFASNQIKEGEIENGILIVRLDDIIVRFPLEGDKGVLITSLNLVLNKYRELGEMPKEIDLRYKNPVIK